MNANTDAIAVTSDSVHEDDVIVTVDLRTSGGPSLVQGIVHRSPAANEPGTEVGDRPPSPYIDYDDANMADIIAVSRLRWGYDPQKFTCPYCKVDDFSANHLEHTPFVWAGSNILRLTYRMGKCIDSRCQR
jgi:hypothetical protein